MVKKHLYKLARHFGLIKQPIISAPSICTKPDSPIAFAFKTDWLAIKSQCPKTVLNKLPLINVQIANWESGFQIIASSNYQNNLQPIFVSPSIQGWVFVISRLSLPQPNQTSSFDSLMNPLLNAFEEVQYFGSYHVCDYVAWAKAEKGQWIRRFAWADGGILDHYGEQTFAEKSLHIVDIKSEQDLEQETLFEQWIESYDEETPAQLAGLWSINPLALEKMNLSPSTGWLGYMQKINE